MYEVELVEFLNSLLFRDNNGIAYNNDCSQNRLVRNKAKEKGVSID